MRLNYYEHHIGDFAEATAHLSFVEDAAYSRLIRKYYAQEKPLPADIKAVQRLVGARSKDEREAVENMLQEFFDLQADGWHQARCDAEIARYHEKAPDRDAKRENERERQRRARERRKQIFDALRDIGVVPAFDAPMSQLNALLSQHNITFESQHVTRNVTPPVTRDDTATQTPDTRHQTPDSPKDTESTSTTVAPDPTPGARVCLALKAKGIRGNPSHPVLLALVEAGATPQEFVDAAPQALGKADPFAYLLGVVKGQRRDAAEAAKGLHQGAMPQPAASRKDLQLQTAALMTGAAPMPQRQVPITSPETIDVESRILPP